MTRRTRRQKEKDQEGNAKATAPTDKIALAAEVLARADQEITIREGGQPRKMTLRAAVIAAQIKSALEGSVYAQSQTLKLIERYDQFRAIEISRDHEFWNDRCKVKRAEIEAAKSRGEPEPDFLPHPDDIVFEDGKPVIFRGPVTEADLARCKSNQEWSIQMLRLDALKIKEREKGESRSKQTGALLCFTVFQQGLPPRLRLSEVQTFLHQEHFLNMNKRVLLKEIQQGWRKLGKTVKRGQNFPAFDVALKNVRPMFGFIGLAQKGEIDTETLARGHFSESDSEKLANIGIPISTLYEKT